MRNFTIQNLRNIIFFNEETSEEERRISVLHLVFSFILGSSHSISQVKCSCKIGENESRLYPQGLWIKLFALAASAVAVTKANEGNGKVERMFPEHLARSAHFTAANSRQLFNLSAYTTCFFRLPRNILDPNPPKLARVIPFNPILQTLW